VTEPMLPPETLEQIETLNIDARRPLLICDADGVLFEFMGAFEAFLDGRGLYFDWASFRLVGNVRRRSDDTPLPADAVTATLDGFFAERTAHLDPLPGASESLAAISRRAQIVVLSNVPYTARTDRIACLRRHGMDYPVIANKGAKGPAVRRLVSGVDAPVVFVDDIPRNHSSVAADAAHVNRIYFSADARCLQLFGPSPESHHQTDGWPATRAIIENFLDAAGH
jgi:hypothetical protein